MVIYGDSHAAMWLDALDPIAKTDHWRLIDLGKGACPADALSFPNPAGAGPPGSLDVSVQSMAHIRHPTDKSAETRSFE